MALEEDLRVLLREDERRAEAVPQAQPAGDTARDARVRAGAWPPRRAH